VVDGLAWAGEILREPTMTSSRSTSTRDVITLLCSNAMTFKLIKKYYSLYVCWSLYLSVSVCLSFFDKIYAHILVQNISDSIQCMIWLVLLIFRPTLNSSALQTCQLMLQQNAKQTCFFLQYFDLFFFNEVSVSALSCCWRVQLNISTFGMTSLTSRLEGGPLIGDLHPRTKTSYICWPNCIRCQTVHSAWPVNDSK